MNLKGGLPIDKVWESVFLSYGRLPSQVNFDVTPEDNSWAFLACVPFYLKKSKAKDGLVPILMLKDGVFLAVL